MPIELEHQRQEEEVSGSSGVFLVRKTRRSRSEGSWRPLRGPGTRPSRVVEAADPLNHLKAETLNPTQGCGLGHFGQRISSCSDQGAPTYLGSGWLWMQQHGTRNIPHHAVILIAGTPGRKFLKPPTSSRNVELDFKAPNLGDLSVLSPATSRI